MSIFGVDEGPSFRGLLETYVCVKKEDYVCAKKEKCVRKKGDFSVSIRKNNYLQFHKPFKALL